MITPHSYLERNMRSRRRNVSPKFVPVQDSSTSCQTKNVQTPECSSRNYENVAAILSQCSASVFYDKYILSNIITYINPTSCLRLSEVCRVVRDICQDESIWKFYCLEYLWKNKVPIQYLWKQ